MRKKRKNYTAQEKVAILKRHLVDKIPVSDLCDQYQLKPTVYYSVAEGIFRERRRRFRER